MAYSSTTAFTRVPGCYFHVHGVVIQLGYTGEIKGRGGGGRGWSGAMVGQGDGGANKGVGGVRTRTVRPNAGPIIRVWCVQCF